MGCEAPCVVRTCRRGRRHDGGRPAACPACSLFGPRKFRAGGWRSAAIYSAERHDSPVLLLLDGAALVRIQLLAAIAFSLVVLQVVRVLDDAPLIVRGGLVCHAVLLDRVVGTERGADLHCIRRPVVCILGLGRWPASSDTFIRAAST